MAASLKFGMRCVHKTPTLRLYLPRTASYKSHNYHFNAIRNCLHTKNYSTVLHRPNRLVRQTHKHDHFGKVCGVMAVRLNSTLTESTQGEGAYIPLPPDASSTTKVSDVTNIASTGGDPSLAELGLGGWTPPGLIQSALDQLHHIFPWWTAIAIGVFIIRCIMIPLVVKGRKNTINMHNNMPEMNRLQDEIKEASRKNDLLDAALLSVQLEELKSKSNFSTMNMFLMPAVQIPVFLSVFWGLRGMTELPMESLKTGGILWFTDLTVQDPFYLLPVLTSATLLLTLEVGADGVSTTNMGNKGKWFMRTLPIIFLPVMLKFPAAMLCYWFTSNVVSLFQVLLLKQKSVEQYFDMPQRVTHPTKNKDPRSFKQKWKDQKEDAKLSHQIKNVHKFDAEAFEKAGKGPIPKTYKIPPKISKSVSS